MVFGLFGKKAPSPVAAAKTAAEGVDDDLGAWPWPHTKEPQLRGMVKTRILYQARQKELLLPERPDFPDNMQRFMGNADQRAWLKKLWREEVYAFKASKPI